MDATLLRIRPADKALDAIVADALVIAKALGLSIDKTELSALELLDLGPGVIGGYEPIGWSEGEKGPTTVWEG